jgi:hypothetical protein
MADQIENEVKNEVQTDITAPSSDDKNIATVTHLGGTVFSFIPGLLVWILKKDDSAYVCRPSERSVEFSNYRAHRQLYCQYFNLADYWFSAVTTYLASQYYILHYCRHC